MTWTVGIQKDGNEIKEMLFDVDEISIKEHYLYIYDIEERKVEKDGDGDIVDLEPEEIAKVKGFISPKVWLYAIQTSIKLDEIERAQDT